MKIKILKEFYETALVDKEWKLEGVGEGDERKLLERFSSVTAVFQSLPTGSRQVCAPRSRCFVMQCWPSVLRVSITTPSCDSDML